MVARETSISQGLAQLGLSASETEISRLALLADLLENEAVDLGFLGPNEGPRVVSRHLLESAALVPHLEAEGPVADVGSGAGLPGLALAALGNEVILVEAQARRADFLRRAIERMHVDAEVAQLRAEDAGRGVWRERVGTATARALAAPPVAMELCLPLVRIGGRFLLVGSPDAGSADESGTEGSGSEEVGTEATTTPRGGASSPGGDPQAADEAAEPVVSAALVEVADLLGGNHPRWESLAVPGADVARWVMIVDKVRPTPDRFPRRPGVPKRRPLGGDVASVN